MQRLCPQSSADFSRQPDIFSRVAWLIRYETAYLGSTSAQFEVFLIREEDMIISGSFWGTSGWDSSEHRTPAQVEHGAASWATRGMLLIHDSLSFAIRVLAVIGPLPCMHIWKLPGLAIIW